jgi:RNA polymerase sigma-70 factor (ECF subfamily)
MPRQNPQSLAAILRTATEITDDRAAELWTKYRTTGDPTTFNVLWLWIGNRVYPVLRGLLRDDESAEDGVQAVMVQLLKKRHTMPEFTSARAWLRGMAINIAKQIHRSGGRRTAGEQRAAKPDTIADDEKQRAVRQALADLSEDDRDLIVRRHLARQTITEASAELGYSEKTFSQRLAAAEERLRELLAALGVAVTAASGADAVALPLARSSLAPERLAELLARAWNATTPAATGWTKTALVAGVVLFTGGLAIGGWVLTREGPAEPQMPPGPAEPITPRLVPKESVAARNRKLLDAQVLPKAIAALRKLVPEGTVKVVTADTFQTHAVAQFELRPQREGAMVWAVRIDYEAASQDQHLEYDLVGNGRFREVNPNQPIVIDPLLPGKKIVLGGTALEELVAAFRELPADAETRAEFDAHTQRWEAAVKPYLGQWYIAGDAARRVVVKMDHHNLQVTHRGHTWTTYARWVRTVDVINFDWKQYKVTLSPDGQKLTLSDGTTWTSKPGS